MKQILSPLLLIIIGTLAAPSIWATQNDCSDDSRYGEITRKELEAKIQSKSVTVIDVNSPESFKDQHIPSAFHYGSHEKDFSGMLPQKKEGLIVAYCGGPACTAWKKAATAACQLGYSNVKHFKPGIKGWKNPA